MFLWSILAYLRPCNINHRNRFSIFKQYFVVLNIQGFNFTNGFKCSDNHRFNEVNYLSINIFELTFYQGQKKWRHELRPIEVSKNETDRVFDLLIYKNQFALIKKFNVFLGDHHKTFTCTRCLNSCTNENLLKLHKPKFENNDITTIRTSPQSQFYWKKQLHKNPLFFEYTKNLKLVMKSIILGQVIKQLLFISKTRYLKVILKYLNWEMF